MGINVVDMGLVAGMDLQGDVIQLRYRLTSHTCPVGGMITSAMHDALEGVPGVLGAELTYSDDPPWGPELMTPEGRAALGL
jgi:metal-sulfur cluster biosynthetic enzyme